MSIDEWSDDEFNQIVDAIGDDEHPIQIARRFHKPVKDVAAFWHDVIAGWIHDGLTLPPRVAEFRRRKGMAAIDAMGGRE